MSICKEIEHFLLFFDIVMKIWRKYRYMAKRKKKNSHLGAKVLNYIAWVLALIALILSSIVAGYYFGYEDAKEEIVVKKSIEKEKTSALLTKLEKATAIPAKESVQTRLKKVLKKETPEYISASHELDSIKEPKAPKRVQREVKHSPSKPKLAIIIDDVSIASHVKAVKSLSLPITMSFLPPRPARPNSAELASHENVYMVHLPMEAQNYSAEEPETLRISDSQKKISFKIREIKKLFPKVSYINNHTGSKFTSNEVAMNRLINALNENKISFIDSRTTAKTKAPEVLENFGLNYIARDVFLDHEPEKDYILKQIKKAVKVAKKHGTAIAIGHPHKNTILALSESKEVLKDVELVYINRLH